MTLRTNNTVKLLKYVKDNPGLTSTEIAGALTNTHTALEVTSGLWGLWAGRYITREKTGTADKGPKFRYFFKTDSPRKKPRHTKRRGKYKPRTVVAAPAKVAEDFDSPVEILIAVKGCADTLMVTPTQARALHDALHNLLVP